jgi:chromosomal replication initiation ATPase DnaA
MKAGVVDDRGQSLGAVSLPTEAHRGQEFGLERMCEAIRQAVAAANLKMEDIAAIGVATPGTMDIPAGLILDETAAYFGLTRDDLTSKSRSRPLTTARHVAMYLLRDCTGLSLIKIGEWFDRDHTTVLHGIKKIEMLMRDRAPIFRQVQDLTRKIRARSQGA